MQDDDTEKTFDPTDKKLADARRDGNVPQSRDLNTAFVFLGFILALGLFGKEITNDLGLLFQNAVSLNFPNDGSIQKTELFDALKTMILSSVFSIYIIFLLPMFGVIASLVVQKSVTFSGKKLHLKLNRISVLQNAKQKFGLSGLFEWGKSLVKLIIFSVILFAYFLTNRETIFSLSGVPVRSSILYISKSVGDIVVLFFLTALVIGLIDVIFQNFEHKRKLRMSRKEILDEQKDSEGDPHQKNERRQRGRARAMDPTIQLVETADVVITNPTHYAVALQWSRLPGSAPICVCKGVDHIAFNIRARAREHNVPIHEDPPTARAIFATTENGDEVPPHLYKAVAAAINFSDTVRKRANFSES